MVDFDLGGPMCFHRDSQSPSIQVQVWQLAKLPHVTLKRVYSSAAATACSSPVDAPLATVRSTDPHH